jgi:transcription elongation factor/antiterminator RfaH
VSGKEWYVLQSKLHKETQVNRLLQTREIETFFPTLTVKPVNPRAAKVQAFFPGYLFIHVDLDALGVNTFEWIPGAIHLIQFNDRAAAVPDHLIERLRQHVHRQSLKPVDPLDGLKSGDKIDVRRGSFAGYDAIFDTRLSGGERARILIHLLGRTIKAEINVSAISKRSN